MSYGTLNENNQVVAVVVTHNRKEMLEKCIQALLDQQDALCDVLVVDNGCTDGTKEMLESRFSGSPVSRLCVGLNTGSAGGFKHGVAEAMRRGYCRIWVMDDDVIPTAEALSRLVEADVALGGAWGFLSSLALWVDGTPCRPNVQKRGLISFVGVFDYRRDLVPVAMASMASLYLNANAVSRVGLPIAEYYFYSDDYEYTARLSDVFPCYFVPSSIVIHHTASDTKADVARDPRERLWRYRYLYRNDVHLYRRYGLKGWAYLVTKALWSLGRIALLAPGERLERAGIVCSSLREGLSFNPAVEVAPRSGQWEV